MGQSATNTLPSRSYPTIRGSFGRGLPTNLPGGQEGPEPLPSRNAVPIPMGGFRTGTRVPGGAVGPIKFFTPSIDKQAPFYLGNDSGNAQILRRGIDWLRGRFANTAAIHSFEPQLPATPNWTSNRTNPAAMPASDIPWSRKGFNGQGGLRREAFVDEQLFDQLPKWIIQRPLKRNVKRSQQQPSTSNPYFQRLTRWEPASSYGQTTKTLISQQAMQNILQQITNIQAGGTYGGY